MRLLLALLLFTLPLHAQTELRHQRPDLSGATILVKPKKDKEKDSDKFHGEHGGRKLGQAKHTPWHKVRLPSDSKAARKALDAYRASDLFEAVQEDHEWKAQAVPNDPMLAQQWALQKIQAFSAWDHTGTNIVVVAINDTGIDFTHPDLAAAAWTGPNGEHGWRAQFGGIIPANGDSHGHGTHCAGIVGAIANNGVGIAGLAKVRLMDLAFMGPEGGGTTSAAIDALEAGIDAKLRGVPLMVINCSWGGGARDQALIDTLQACEDAGINVVCAAGNAGLDVDVNPFYPAQAPIDSLLSIMATDQNDAKPNFSNFGQGVHMGAPGFQVISTTPRTNYAQFSGTSEAAPHISGAIALMRSLNPALTPKQAWQILLSKDSFDQLGLNSLSGGRLNLAKLVNNPDIEDPVVSVPPVLTVTGSNAVLNAGQSVRWVASANQPVLYRIKASSDLGSSYAFDLFGGKRFTEIVRQASNDFICLPKAWAQDGVGRYVFSAFNDYARITRVERTAFALRSEALRTNLATMIAGFDFTAEPLFGSWVLKNNLRMPGFTGTYTVQFDWEGEAWGILFGLKVNSNNTTWTQQFATTPTAVTARAYVFDDYGNFAMSTNAVIRFQDDARVPELKYTMSTNRGPAPHTVRFDCSASNPNNVPTEYSLGPWPALEDPPRTSNPVLEVTLPEIGSKPYELCVYDMGYRTKAATVVMISALPKIAVPVKLVAANLSMTAKGLVWNDACVGEDRWTVERSTRRGQWGPFSTLATLPANSTNYSTTGGTKVRFRVRASLLTTNGPYSNIVQ